ncbi:MAG: transposase family protein [Anaerolineae bacterium]|nr:transposase family protein [Anaerolineae bacterium]
MVESKMDANLTLPLDIPDVKVLETTINPAGDCVITVESTLETARCRQCGRAIDKLHGRGDALRLRHLPLWGQRVYISIWPKQYQCLHCPGRPVTTQRLAWYNPGSPNTRAYEEAVLLQMVSEATPAASLRKSLAADALADIVKRWMSQPVDWSKCEGLQQLGLNEIALQDGCQSRAMIVTAEKVDGHSVVLAVLKDCRKETIREFLQAVPSHIQAD